MDVGRSFSYMFEDEDWPKRIVIGGLVNLVPILNLACQGYSLRIIRAASTGEEPKLPDWDELGTDWVKGLLQMLAMLILSLPAWPGLIAALAVGEATSPGNTDPWVVCCFGVACLSVLWLLLVGIVYPMGRVHYAQTDEFAAFFRFRTIFKAIGRHLEDYAVALLLAVVVMSLSSMIGPLLCLVGVGFTAFYAQLVTADLLGQMIAGDDTMQGPPAEPPAPRPAPAGQSWGEPEIEAALDAEIEQELDPEALSPAEPEDYGGPEA